MTALPLTALPFHRFAGTHRDIGRQYGEACADLVVRHRDLALERLGLPLADVVAAALEYRPFVRRYAEFLDEEIAGVAEGAGIPLGEAYLLQLRAEVYAHLRGDPRAANECTTFAVQAPATANGVPLIGQNADLPSLYRDLMVVAHIAPAHGPDVLMLLPAGQVSYIGVNDRGMGAFANFLDCAGWRVGFPRYLLTRYALRHASVGAALAAVRGLHRASSRNLIMLDADGRAADYENTPTRDAVLYPEDGLLAHSNHYVAVSLRDEERARPAHLENSRSRLARINLLMKGKRGQLDAATIATILRDRASFPHALSRLPGDQPGSDDMTVASVIAEPTEGQLWAASGAPSEGTYHRYSFAYGLDDAAML